MLTSADRSPDAAARVAPDAQQSPPNDGEGGDLSWEIKHRRMHQAQAISRVGSWHYEFATESLTISDTLADLYELPHGTVPARLLGDV